MIVEHFNKVKWNTGRWPNFDPTEFACRHCGEFYYDENAFDAIQMLRRTINNGVYINSAHRCWRHNLMVGGAPSSMHKKIAFDISTNNQDRKLLLESARRVGFRGYGFYASFLHVDLGVPRVWATKEGRERWNSLIS